MATFRIVRGNTAPPYSLTCTRDGVAIDLTGCTVSLIIKGPDGTITNTGHQAATITTAASGIISYTAQAADFDGVGTFVGDARVVYADGGVEILRNQIKWKARDKNS